MARNSQFGLANDAGTRHVDFDGKAIELRLKGERTDIRTRLPMKIGQGGEVEAEERLEMDEDRLADLSRRVYISVRVAEDEGEQRDADAKE